MNVDVLYLIFYVIIVLVLLATIMKFKHETFMIQHSLSSPDLKNRLYKMQAVVDFSTSDKLDTYYNELSELMTEEDMLEEKEWEAVYPPFGSGPDEEMGGCKTKNGSRTILRDDGMEESSGVRLYDYIEGHDSQFAKALEDEHTYNMTKKKEKLKHLIKRILSKL